MQEVANEMGVGETFTLAPLGIYFGEKEGVENPDPYFGGDGPKRKSCINCGECMTGCRHNAKNTLVKNYLYLAEKQGVEVRPLTTVTELIEQNGLWSINVRKSTSWLPVSKTITANQVVVAAGAFNTQKLLHRMKSKGNLKLSDALGKLSRTNSESLVGAIMPKSKLDFSEGAAITSSFFPNRNTHVEPVRYGKGSNMMGLLQTIMTSSDSALIRTKQWLLTAIKKPTLIFRILNVRKWSERSVIALVMQSIDSSVTVFEKKFFPFGSRLSSKNDATKPNPTWIPEANEVAERIANNYGGFAGGNVGNLIGAPFTAHFVGGCVIGKDKNAGVIDPYHRVWGYPTLHILDGSTITANLGVNPSLTITAQAERALSMWPINGEAEQRPEQGQSYKYIKPIEPKNGMRK
jgi:cholesterol oxidase